MNKGNYNEMATAYAEKYGVCEFTVKGNTMVYYTSYPMEKTTYKAVVNLDTTTETREAMKRYYKPWKHIGGVQINYMV